jgi:hypothetical protein
MDKFLRPHTLDIDPELPTAADEWEMWLANFKEFIKAIDAALNPDKLVLLKAHVSCSIYKLIKDSTTFEDAEEILKARFVKPKSDIYARHKLFTTRQQPGETLSQFLDQLKSLSLDCNFKAITAEKIREEAIRDAFINGMSSSAIRQRLLEFMTLDLATAVSHARAMEMAQIQSDSYGHASSTSFPTAAISDAAEEVKEEEHDVTAKISNIPSRKCFFCGGPVHPRAECRARNATCNNCRKVGHFAKVCRSASRPKTSFASAILGAASVNLNCLSSSLADVSIDGHSFKALIDTGSSRSFIDADVARSLRKLQISDSNDVITMASNKHKMVLREQCNVEMKLNGRYYTDVSLLLFSNLCAPVLLGHDFLRRHAAISLEFGGELPSLNVCGLAVASIEPPPLFSNLTSDCHPIQTRSRRHNESDQKFIDAEVERMLREGIIVPSRSPWRAQALVIDHGSKKRLVIDYSQTINRFTQLNAYPLPGITEMIEKISKFKVFSSIDLKSAYHQIPIKDEERKFTAFEASGKLFEFLRVPFGVTNGVACFQQVINDIIRSENLQNTFAYVDDLTICGNSQEDHDENLRRFRGAVEKYGLTLNEDKCKFNRTSITLLGHVIENKKVSPDLERMRPLMEMPVPSDMNSLRRALGLLSYYSKWIPRFSEKLRPILSVKAFPLSTAAVKAFEEMKTEISEASLHAIEDGVPFVVETDASDGGIAASLSQDGRPIAFFSRALAAAERHHSSMEREACAIVEAIRKWRHFLLGKHFLVVTDQQAVRYMFDGKNKGKIKNEKILRWRLELSCFSFDITYRDGKKNVVADALSRMPFDCVAALTDDDLARLHDVLCHPGVTRLWHVVRSRNLPFSLEDVKATIRRCKTCSEVKPNFVKFQGTLIKATRPFERLNVDFKGPLPTSSKNRYLFVVIDEFSRFPFAFPTKDTSTDSALQCLFTLFSVCGLPDMVHSDRGSAFTSGDYQRALHERGVATNYCSPYNPRGNGQVERYNGVLWRNIRLALHARKLPTESWEAVLPDALHSMRSLLCTSTNATPHERFFTFPRKATYGKTMPSWLLTSQSALLKKAVVQSKYDPNMEAVELVHTNPEYARVRHANGNESTVSLRRLAPMAKVESTELNTENNNGDGDCASADEDNAQLRRSTRVRNPPQRYDPSSYQ